MSGKTCGAKKRNGEPCSSTFLSANGRCRMHGGTNPGAPKGNQNAVTHGFYARGLHPDEAAGWDDVPLGDLDNEIKLCRVQLARVTAAQRAFEDDPEDETLLTLTEVTAGEEGVEIKDRGDGHDGGGIKLPASKTSRSITRSRPDYHKLVLSLTGRIADLEARRKILMDGGEKKFHEVRFIIED